MGSFTNFTEIKTDLQKMVIYFIIYTPLKKQSTHYHWKNKICFLQK